MKRKDMYSLRIRIPPVGTRQRWHQGMLYPQDHVVPASDTISSENQRTKIR